MKNLTNLPPEVKQVLSFWFEELSPSKWWEKDEELDQQVKERFGDIHKQAKAMELYSWRSEPHGRLAEIIVLDQFSRNMFRNTPRSFENDQAALALSQEAVLNNAHKDLNASEQAFLFMPFMHSESLMMQKKALELYSKPGLEDNYDFSMRHHDIIERFGRYPHRNEILNRESTKEELEFLSQPNSSF